MHHRMKSILIVLPLLLVVSSCATTGGGGLNLLPLQEDIRLGQELSAEIEKEQPVLQDPVIQRYVSDVGNRIVANVGGPEFPYSFKVIKSDEVNAFALPGGPVYVNTGLLAHADNEAELASVIAHEIAHVAERHATQQLSASVGVQMLSEILLGKNPAATTALATNIVTSLGMLKFSRNDEIQADRMGARYMFEAGYNPTAMIDMHRKLAQLQESSPSSVMNWFSTHPMSQQRIDAIATEIAAFPPGRPVQYYSERYADIIKKGLR